MHRKRAVYKKRRRTRGQQKGRYGVPYYVDLGKQKLAQIEKRSANKVGAYRRRLISLSNQLKHWKQQEVLVKREQEEEETRLFQRSIQNLQKINAALRQKRASRNDVWASKQTATRWDDDY